MDRDQLSSQMTVDGTAYTIWNVRRLKQEGIADVERLPYAIKILVENLMRRLDGRIVRDEDLKAIATWQKAYATPVEIPHHPARVLMQDFTGVPAVVDLAAMRDAVQSVGQDPYKINPLVPVDLVVDHSVQVDHFGTTQSQTHNVAKEYARNGERYQLLKWAQKSFSNFKVVPPNSGICHQVNLEYLAAVVRTEQADGEPIAFPDSLVGTDSHTTMINALGVMGWGVGGIEAEAVMLGQPYYMTIPEVIGMRLTGSPKAGVTATDIVLTITQILRNEKVVEKFVEFFGPGMKQLSLPDRATIANMSPEYGATMGFFPVDEKTIDYLNLTNRKHQAALVEAYTKACGMFYSGDHDPKYTRVVELDLSTVAPCVAGPARPQDRILLTELKKGFAEILGDTFDSATAYEQRSPSADTSGPQTGRALVCKPVRKAAHRVDLNGRQVSIGDGSIVIAAITSCTNTSNPDVLVGAGLVAQKAVERGLRVPEFVKTSLAPGSRVVSDYLDKAGLMPYFKALGFDLVAYGCTTCIGNSGPLHPEIERVIKENGLTVASVLSGNRNFEARIHQQIKANFLASPMLVVAFALAGRIDIDLDIEPVGIDPNGQPVYLDELWPTPEEIAALVKTSVNPKHFADQYARIFDGDTFWQQLSAPESATFDWDPDSTYIKKPPYFEDFSLDLTPPQDIADARVLLAVGDSVTTDHISPAGAIPEAYPAGRYLIQKGVSPQDFNSYGSRRGNHEVMMRGTFGNIRIKNQLVAPKEGSYTRTFPENKEGFIYDAAMQYLAQQTPLAVLGGKEYGTGSSRDWAAKGTSLLGIKAILTESYERIHRSNLVGMGALPLIFESGDGWRKLGLTGEETISITGIAAMTPRKRLRVKARRPDGSSVEFDVMARLDTEVDVTYFLHGGILPYVLRQVLTDE